MIRRRHVFFIAGFDPKGPGHYHALYATQAALQAKVTGLDLHVGARRNVAGEHSAVWPVTAPDAGVDTTFEMLRWDDLVRAGWQRHPFMVLAQAADTAWRVARCGSMTRMFALSRPVVIAAMCPLWLAALALFLALALAALVVAVARRLEAPAWLAFGIGAAIALTLVCVAVVAIHRIQIGWFSRLVRFIGQLSRGELPEAEARIDDFARRIVQSPGDIDELLIVGHSVGGNLAVSAIARALRAAPDLAARGPRVSLLTLGQCMPMESTLDTASRFHAELKAVAQADIDWLDVSAPLDWAAFPLTDPLAGLRVRPPPEDWHPHIVSPRFHALFTEAGYARLRARRFLLHLQYLMAAELPGRYDYFAITAGALTLRERFSTPE